MDKLVVAIIGLAGIIFTYWFFLMREAEASIITHDVTIIIDGGYTPEKIIIPYGQKTKLNFYRKDPSSCLEEVVLSDFKIRRYLPLNQKMTIEIVPDKKGEFVFTCGMNMYHGKIVIK